MSDHPTHKLNAYLDDRKWVAFCKVCSAEGDLLALPCPNQYVPASAKPIDTAKEHK